MNNKTSAKKASLFLLLISISFVLFAQKTEKNKTELNCCKLVLPDEWEKDRRLTRSIQEVLKKTIPELFNSSFCDVENPAYRVFLLIDTLEISNETKNNYPVPVGLLYSKSFSGFNYSFYAALVIYDSINNEVSRLRLLSTDDIHNYTSYTNNWNLQAVERINIPKEIRDTSGKVIRYENYFEYLNYSSSVPENYYMAPENVLTPKFLHSICEQKIYTIREILRKLN